MKRKDILSINSDGTLKVKRIKNDVTNRCHEENKKKEGKASQSS